MNIENKAKTSRGRWNDNDVSPYDLKEREIPINQAEARNNYRYDTYIPQEDEIERQDLNQSFDEYDSEFDNYEEDDMYMNHNINCGCGNHCSNQNPEIPENCPIKSVILEKNTVIEEENPKKTTTIWVKITKTY